MQGLWLLDEDYLFFKVQDDGAIASRRDCRDRGSQQGLAQALGTTPGTHNVDRLLRLPGTINWPNKVKLAKGRVACQASVVKLTEARYSLDQFAKAAPADPKASAVSDNVENIAPDDARLAKLDARWIALGYEDEGLDKYPSRSEAVFALTCACFRARSIRRPSPRA